jgi:succinate dehydrogenase flavin-adding protein (antitoxin of CptAB toxin-antitoxin module)
MSVFQRLQKLFPNPVPYEDFFTELAAGVLDACPELLEELVKYILGETPRYSRIRIDSQYRLPRLSNHLLGSRPDIFIILSEPEAVDVILFESKLGTGEHDNQLQRYAEHLADTFSEARRRTLVYITQYHDPKNIQEITAACKSKVEVKLMRWQTFYTIAQKYRSNPLVGEMLTFMEEQRMSEKRDLQASELFALTTFPRIMNFLTASFGGSVRTTFEEVVCTKPSSYKDMLTQLKHHNRFILYGYPSEHLWIGVGYWFASQNDEYPTIGAVLEIAASSRRWQEIASCLKEVAENPPAPDTPWYSYHLDQPHSWAGIISKKSILPILAIEDHLTSVQNTLLQYLGQIEQIKLRHPGLLSK